MPVMWYQPNLHTPRFPRTVLKRTLPPECLKLRCSNSISVREQQRDTYGYNSNPSKISVENFQTLTISSPSPYVFLFLCKYPSARIQSYGYTSSIHTSEKSSWQQVSCISTGHCLHRVPSSIPQPSCNGVNLWVEATAIARGLFPVSTNLTVPFFSLSTGSLLMSTGNCL